MKPGFGTRRSNRYLAHGQFEVHGLRLGSGERTWRGIICLTNHSDSPIAHVADPSLFTSTRISHFREQEMASNVATMAMIEALYVGICVHRSDESELAAYKTMYATRHRKY